MLGPELENLATAPITFAGIAQQLSNRMAEKGQTIEQLSEEIGWDLQPILADPEELWDYDTVSLYSITKFLGLDWVAALPRLHDDGPKN